MSNSLTPTLVGAIPLASDINQYHDLLNGLMDVGKISLASSIQAPNTGTFSVAPSVGTGLGIGTYIYKFGFVTGTIQANNLTTVSGLTPGSTSLTVTTTSGNQQVTINGLPAIGTWPLTAIGITIYRTAVGGADGTQKLVMTLYTDYVRTSNQITYVDSLQDGSLGAVVPTANTTGTVIDGVVLTGTPTAPTATAGTNTTQIATTAFTKAQDQRAASLVVAASNSSAKGKAAADYVCTGTNDETTINNAFALLPNGGKVVLLEGLFSIAGSLMIRNNISLEGQGNGTVLQIANATNKTVACVQNVDSTNGNTGITISNLKMDGNKANNAGGGIQNGVYFNKVTYSTVENVTAINMRNEGIYLDVSSSNNTVIGSTCQNNNYGISMVGASNNTITGNTCQGNIQNGIYLFSSSNNTITANMVLENSQITNILYDNIFVDNTSNTNNIQGNTCRQGALTNKPRYGIRINVSTCTGNLVTNNDLTTGGATGAFSDVGTSTVTTAGNKLA